ncbi:MAG: hypothetical protein AAGF72_09745 [Pseudomonadota bacterium]
MILGRRYGDGSRVCEIAVLAVTSGGDVVVAGETGSSAPESAVIVLGINLSGSEVWRTFFDRPENDVVVDAASIPWGGAVILGVTEQFPASGIGEGPFLAKVTDAGAVEWVSQIGNDDSSYADIVTDSAGHTFASGNVLIPGVSTDVSILRLNPTGELAWNTVFSSAQDDTPCCVSADRGIGIGLDAEGNVYVGAVLTNVPTVLQVSNDGAVS